MQIKFKNTKEALDAYKQLLENHLGKVEIIIEDEVAEPTNPFLVPDEDGWFTHDPSWENEEPPVYVMRSRPITIFYRDGIETALAFDFNWKQGMYCSIIKWKYVD